LNWLVICAPPNSPWRGRRFGNTGDGSDGISRGGRKRIGSRALCIGVGKKSELTFIRELAFIRKLMFILGQLDPSPNSVDSRFEVIQSPGQTMEEEQV